MEEKKTDPEPKPKDPEPGNLPGGGTGNPSDGVVKESDFKALQKKLSEKDLALRKSILEFDEFKEKGDKDKSEFAKIVKTFNDKIDGLAKEVKTLNDEKRRKALQAKYPDMAPELLIGKDPEVVEKIVKKQRAINKQLYGDSKVFSIPTYGSQSDIDKEVKSIEDNPKVSGETAGLRILRLSREKRKLLNKKGPLGE